MDDLTDLQALKPLPVLCNLARRRKSAPDKYALRWYDTQHLANAMATILERATPDEMELLQCILFPPSSDPAP